MLNVIVIFSSQGAKIFFSGVTAPQLPPPSYRPVYLFQTWPARIVEMGSGLMRKYLSEIVALTSDVQDRPYNLT